MLHTLFPYISISFISLFNFPSQLFPLLNLVSIYFSVEHSLQHPYLSKCTRTRLNSGHYCFRTLDLRNQSLNLWNLFGVKNIFWSFWNIEIWKRGFQNHCCLGSFEIHRAWEIKNILFEVPIVSKFNAQKLETKIFGSRKFPWNS